MSPEAQRVAIADYCKLPPEVTWKLPSSFVVDNENRFLLPDFTNDLNACHEMEKTLIGKGQLVMQNYLDNLCIITNGESAQMDGSYQEVQEMIHATAAQRCEAFLKTLNLWKE